MKGGSLLPDIVTTHIIYIFSFLLIWHFIKHFCFCCLPFYGNSSGGKVGIFLSAKKKSCGFKLWWFKVSKLKFSLDKCNFFSWPSDENTFDYNWNLSGLVSHVTFRSERYNSLWLFIIANFVQGQKLLLLCCILESHLPNKCNNET